MTDSSPVSRDVVVFGTGHVAEVIAVYLERFSNLNIVGYTVDSNYLPEGGCFNGKPVVPWERIEASFPPDQTRLMGPLTYQRLNQVRRDRYLEGKARGYSFASFIHPASHILTDDIGENVIILEQNVIQPFSKIGNNVIIWSFNHIGHHVTIGDHCFLASMLGISGNVKIGNECFLGGQVGITHGLSIGDRCALLNGVGIDRSVPDDTAVIGTGKVYKRLPSSRIMRFL